MIDMPLVRIMDEDTAGMAKDSKVKSEGIDVPKRLLPPTVIDLYPNYSVTNAMSGMPIVRKMDEDTADNVKGSDVSFSDKETGEEYAYNNEISLDNVSVSDKSDQHGSTSDTTFDPVAIENMLNDAARKVFVKCSPPPCSAKEFSTKDFEEYMGDREELMTKLLCSSLPDPPSIQSYQELEEFLSNRQTYHTMSVPKECIKSVFFKTFKKEHFRYIPNEDTSGNSVYPLTIFQTEALFTSNKEMIAHMKNTANHLINLTTKKGVFNKVNKMFDVDRTNFFQKKDKLGAVEMVTKVWKTAWDGKSDGDQTNVTLIPESTKNLTKHLVDKEVLKDGDQICDFGSSYGSLVLNIVNHSGLKITGYGIEQSALRHTIGCNSFAKCIRQCQEMDYCPLKNFSVELVRQDLTKITELPSSVNHVIAFNKAFTPELCITCALLCLNSHNVKTYTDVRASFSKLNLGTSSATFQYKHLMKHLGFVEFAVIKGSQMNGSENAGDFVTYKFEKQKINVKFLENLFLKFFKPLRFDKKNFQGIIDDWKNASTHDLEVKKPKQYPTITGPSSPVISIDSREIKEILEYLDQEGDLENMSTRGLRRTATTKMARLQKSCDGGEIICADEKCEKCSATYPSEKIAKERICYIDEVSKMGMGLFALWPIYEGNYICQFDGNICTDKPSGYYVVKTKGGKFIDTTHSSCFARYANHSCKPNANIVFVMREKWAMKRKKRRSCKDEDTEEDINNVDEVWIKAVKTIGAHEEITVDYGSDKTYFFRNCLCKECS